MSFSKSCVRWTLPWMVSFCCEIISAWKMYNVFSCSGWCEISRISLWGFWASVVWKIKSSYLDHLITWTIWTIWLNQLVFLFSNQSNPVGVCVSCVICNLWETRWCAVWLVGGNEHLYRQVHCSTENYKQTEFRNSALQPIFLSPSSRTTSVRTSVLWTDWNNDMAASTWALDNHSPRGRASDALIAMRRL